MYFTGVTAKQYKGYIGKLAQGEFVKPTHVDIHTQNACNAACAGCIGREGPSVDQRLNPSNIGFVLDQINAGGLNPYIHKAGYTGDSLVGTQYVKNRPTIPWAINTTVAGVIHQLRKGLADRISIVSNGLGFYGIHERGYIPSEEMFDFIVFMPLLGSVQINLNAFYKHRAFDQSLQPRKFNQVMANLRHIAHHRWRANIGDDYYPGAYLEKLSIMGQLPAPLRIVGNFTLTPSNYRFLPALLQELRFNEKKIEFRFTDESLTPPDEEFKYPIDELRLRIDLNRSRNIAFQKAARSFVDKIIAEYADEDIEIILKSPLDPRELEDLSGCPASVLWPAIGPDGLVYPCAHTVASGFEIGSLFEQTLERILEGYFLSNRWRRPPQCHRKCPSTDASINLLGQEIIG